MKRVEIISALLLAVVLAVTFTSGCATAPKRSVWEESSPRRGDAEQQARFDQLEKSNADAMRDIRTSQANLGADLAAVRDEIRTLRGQVEGADRNQEMKKQLDELSMRVATLEESLQSGKKASGGQRAAAADTERSAEGKEDPKAVYEACYKLFKDGQNAKAREGFQQFLKQYPKTPYAGSAQFWIAETWYIEEKYEKAIVEYEKVMKGYPSSDKVPYALLKQGMAFQKLGDKGSAKIVYQQIVKKYPQTNQAKMARAKLAELK